MLRNSKIEPMSELKFYKGKIEDPFYPFSNGTEAMQWQDENCCRCSKAWHPTDKGHPKESTLEQYVRCGKYCKLQYWIDIGFMEGSIPNEIAEQIGKGSKYGLKQTCLLFSDNDNDGYKPPKQPRPDNTPDNQLTMPFFLQEIGVTEYAQPKEHLTRDKDMVVSNNLSCFSWGCCILLG